MFEGQGVGVGEVGGYVDVEFGGEGHYVVHGVHLGHCLCTV